MSAMVIDGILGYLAANGIEVRYEPTGAVGLPNGALAFVREKPDGCVIVDHPPRGGRAQFYQQRFKNRERALAGLLAHKY